MNSSIKINLKSLSKDDLFRFVVDGGLPKYRAGQLIHWMYQKNAASIDDITELSKDLRNRLGEIAYISNLKLVKRLSSSDGAEKFLFALEDEETIESVLIPEERRLTLCISSQVGCATGCLFCKTGACGLIRNLKAHEIVDQIIMVNRILSAQKGDSPSLPIGKEGKGAFFEKKITNIVFMGMGEPLANFDEVVEALWRITDFLGLSKRRITLSTVGIIPKMSLLPLK
ncbi:MAG: 23S rRNA (adenine(2503)-C(2))-methyltransferase RlmN, partial [Nitrospirota bacterium]